jgi:glycosyltransferase involved in cell wall biosynthesis
MVKDEAILLAALAPQWLLYPIDKWVFYDDNSKDGTGEVINDLFGDRAVVFNDRLASFSESHNRSRMFEYSRENRAKFVVSIDADELMSANLLANFGEALAENEMYDVQYFWFNVVGSLHKMRQDPQYKFNFRTFILPVAHCGVFDTTLFKYHTPRTPRVRLQQIHESERGFIHLQAINRRYYALKQLWYKHFEFKNWSHPIEYINARYDPVVNGCNFNERPTPKAVIDGIKFDPKIYDEVEKVKGYRQFILDNYQPELVTFGKEYL